MTVAERRVLADRHARALKIGVLVGMLGILLTTGAMAELAVADLVSAPNPNSSMAQRLRSVWESGDHVHYSIHLAAGRLLDMCPCTAHAAATQYWRASFHARSEQQMTLLTDPRPTNPAARVADGLDLAARWLQWSVAEVPKLRSSILK
jgi:hypothetical protein